MPPARTSPPAVDPHPEVSDEQAVTEVIRGNREMFEVIVRRYNQQLFRVGLAYLKNHGQAEDAMQNAYLKAFINLPRFEGTAAFSTWLTRIMINECLMLLRKRRSAREEPWDEQGPAALPDANARPASAGMNLKEMKTLLEKTIAGLPRPQRTVYVLREVQQMSTAETAAALGISVENVKVSLHRARELLKARLLQSAAGLELFPYHAPFCNRMTARVMNVILGAP